MMSINWEFSTCQVFSYLIIFNIYNDRWESVLQYKKTILQMKKLKLREFLLCLWGLRWTGTGWRFKPLARISILKYLYSREISFFLIAPLLFFFSYIFRGIYWVFDFICHVSKTVFQFPWECKRKPREAPQWTQGPAPFQPKYHSFIWLIYWLSTNFIWGNVSTI